MAMLDMQSERQPRLVPLGVAEQSHPSWPVRIRTLGRFEIELDGVPLQRAGKAQRRPMTLLKVLIALGGTNVPGDRLIQIVWGDSAIGGDQKTLDVTLHRLRKLLGHDNLLRVTDRRVSMNRELVWTDVWALDRAFGAVASCWDLCQYDATALERSESEVLALYTGPFLDGEPDAAWLLPVRNRLSGQFQRFVARQADHWEMLARCGQAVRLFERAIENEPLAESFYLRLMLNLHQQGKRTEAIDVYRRLRRLLAVTLGVEPAAPVQALLQDLVMR